MASLSKLQPKVQQLAKSLIKVSGERGIPIVCTQTLRTIKEQNALYAQGRTTPGSIVTNAKGGWSFHNYGVAFDICPEVNGKLAWERTDLFKKVGALGIALGLEWGGSWTSFKDLPHFQYTAGYTITEFLNGTVSWSDFDVVSTGYKMKSLENGVNIRTGPGTTYAKIGQLTEGQIVEAIDGKNGWIQILYKTSTGWVKADYLSTT